MPRRLPVNASKIMGNFFVFLMIAVMAFQYYVYIVMIWGPRCPTSHIARVVVAGFHLLAIMLVWSFLQTMLTDPG